MIAAIKNIMDTTPQLLPHIKDAMKEVYESHELLYKVYDNGLPDYYEHYAAMMFRRKFSEKYRQCKPNVMDVHGLIRVMTKQLDSLKNRRPRKYLLIFKGFMENYVFYVFRFMLPFCQICYKQDGLTFMIEHKNKPTNKMITIECVDGYINMAAVYDAIGKIGLNKIIEQTTMKTEIKHMVYYISKFSHIIHRAQQNKYVHEIEIREAAECLHFMPYKGKLYTAYCEAANLYMENIFQYEHTISYIYYMYQAHYKQMDEIIDDIRDEFYMFHTQQWINQVYLTQAISNLNIV
jgi:hypothetical protein